VVDVVTSMDYAEFERNSKRSRTVSCLEKTVSELETDRDDLRRLANAWSVGDMDTVALHTEQWLAAVELGLKTRQTSFALVPMVKLWG
jgi:hypothetical protein